MTFILHVEDDRINELARRSPEMKRKVLSSLGEEWINQAQLAFTTTKTEKVVRYGVSGKREVWASLPGYPPAIDTGALRRSLNAHVSGNTVELRGMEYGKFVEAHNRPWIAATAKRAVAKLGDIWRAQL